MSLAVVEQSDWPTDRGLIGGWSLLHPAQGWRQTGSTRENMGRSGAHFFHPPKMILLLEVTVLVNSAGKPLFAVTELVWDFPSDH